jgi:hypothetical protein
MINLFIVGCGEVGNALAEFFKYKVKIHKIDLDLKPNVYVNADDVKILAICYPYTEDFVNNTINYQIDIVPDVTLIFSTVPIGTTRQIPKAIHIPIEGRHPNFDFINMTWHLGLGTNCNGHIYSLLCGAGIDYKSIHTYDNPSITEAMKLLSTLNYGVNIEFERFVADIMKTVGGSHSDWMWYTIGYNKLYKDTGFKRYELTPPNGPIGGHCVVPNAKLLNEQGFDNPFIDMVISQYDNKGEIKNDMFNTI